MNEFKPQTGVIVVAKLKKKTAPQIPVGTTPPRFQQWTWVVLVIALLYTVVVRIHLLHLPLERDEGEFAYIGQLMLKGIPPYQFAFNMKLPGIYAAYALIMALFGQTIVGIRLGILLVNAATIVLIFLLGKRLLNSFAGASAAAVYSVMSVSSSFLAFAGHAIHFVLLFTLSGLLMMLMAIDDRKSTL